MARRNLIGGLWKTMEVVLELVNDIALQLNTMEATQGADQVLGHDESGSGVDGRTGCNMVIDASAQDVQFDNAFFFQIAGQKYYKAVDAAVDISAECVGAGDTISTSGDGTLWMFVNTAGTVDGDTANGTAENEASPIATLAQYSIASNTLPPGADDVCVGAVQVGEGGSGAFTWGDDSISAETQVFYSFENLPGIESALASFTIGSAKTKITYGAADIVLGTGVRVVATGKVDVAFNGTTEVAIGAVGAYLLYILADDTEILIAATSTAANLQAAKDLVRDLTPNPLMPLVGVVYVVARLNAFTPGTTALNLNGIDTTYVTYGAGTNRQEHGRANGSTFTPIDEVLHESAKTGQNQRP